MGTPLPSNPYNTDAQFVANCAYARCVDLETRHTQVLKQETLPVLICARFLGYMILEAPTDIGRTEFATEVVQCLSDNELQKLAQTYKDHFLRVFRSIKGHTPAPSSAPSFYDQRQRISSLLVASVPGHGLSEKALVRDGYRCLFSGKLDDHAVDLGLVPNDDGNSELIDIQTAHIFSQSTNQNLDRITKRDYAASAFAVLARFGQIDTIAELNGPKMHRLENILTLSGRAHELFDSLKVWLERDSTDPINQYRLGSVKHRYGMLDTVVLQNHDVENLPLPDPRYLALHATCARVAHLSGAGEYIEKVLRDIEEIGVLANDGSSDVLYHAIVRRLDVEVC